jgi:hypothetical protein
LEERKPSLIFIFILIYIVEEEIFWRHLSLSLFIYLFSILDVKEGDMRLFVGTKQVAIFIIQNLRIGEID